MRNDLFPQPIPLWGVNKILSVDTELMPSEFCHLSRWAFLIYAIVLHGQYSLSDLVTEISTSQNCL